MDDMESWLPSPSRRRLVAGVVMLAVALVFAVRQLGGGAAPRAAPPLRAAPSAAAASRLVVDVTGAVRHPGVYRLGEESRIVDAVARAGGATAGADLSRVNLAAPLADGEQVVVPTRGGPSSSASLGAASPSSPLDLNTATAEQLDALPGIGPATAAKIVAYRQAHGPFRSADELDGVPGLGPARVARLKGLVLP